MVTSARETWFTRKGLGDSSRLNCPRCDHGFPFGPIFDHHPRQCASCKATLVELATVTVIYLVDPSAAPAIVKSLLKYLEPMTEPDAENELEVLMKFLGIEPAI